MLCLDIFFNPGRYISPLYRFFLVVGDQGGEFGHSLGLPTQSGHSMKMLLACRTKHAHAQDEDVNSEKFQPGFQPESFWLEPIATGWVKTPTNISRRDEHSFNVFGRSEATVSFMMKKKKFS